MTAEELRQEMLERLDSWLQEAQGNPTGEGYHDKVPLLRMWTARAEQLILEIQRRQEAERPDRHIAALARQLLRACDDRAAKAQRLAEAQEAFESSKRWFVHAAERLAEKVDAAQVELLGERQ